MANANVQKFPFVQILSARLSHPLPDLPPITAEMCLPTQRDEPAAGSRMQLAELPHALLSVCVCQTCRIWHAISCRRDCHERVLRRTESHRALGRGSASRPFAMGCHSSDAWRGCCSLVSYAFYAPRRVRDVRTRFLQLRSGPGVSVRPSPGVALIVVVARRPYVAFIALPSALQISACGKGRGSTRGSHVISPVFFARFAKGKRILIIFGHSCRQAVHNEILLSEDASLANTELL